MHTNIELSLKTNFMSFFLQRAAFLQYAFSSITLKILNPQIKVRTYFFIYIWSQMLSSSLDALLKVSKTTTPQKLFASDCVTLYIFPN